MLETETTPQAYIVIPATVFFNETSCMIGINALGIQSKFQFEIGDEEPRINATSGFSLEWPDTDTGMRVLEMYRKSPQRVFVVEFDAHGPVAEHSIN